MGAFFVHRNLHQNLHHNLHHYCVNYSVFVCDMCKEKTAETL